MSVFRVSFKVDANRLGNVLASVHGLVTDLDVSIVEEVPHNKNVKRQSRRKRGHSRQLILEAILNSPDRTLTLADGRKILMNAGYDSNSVYTLKSALVKRGEIDFRNGKMSMKK